MEVFHRFFGVRDAYKSNRSSHSSTSSAYSGSDTMTCHSVEAEEVDLSGLVESIVDSDEEDLAESSDSLTVRDTVRDCLEKDPTDRCEEDVEILLEFTQHLKAFTNMTLAVRRALCSVMVFAVVEKAGTVVMNDGEELDSWSVLINGQVEIEYANGQTEQLHIGDSFGILPTMEKLYHRGVMRTKCDDCQFVCITQTDYYRIQHQGWLEKERMVGQLGLLNIACAAKARPRCITLARPSRDDILTFSILGGYERGFGIFISKVEKGCKAEEVGLKRADQILEVNGNSFEHISHPKALEILRSSTHLSITVKSNLIGFKEMLCNTSGKGRGTPRRSEPNPAPPPLPPPLPPIPVAPVSPTKPAKQSFMTLASKKRLQKALVKMNILPKNTIIDGPIEEINQNSGESNLVTQPDLVNICYDELRGTDYPEHVLKVYKADQTCKYLLVHKVSNMFHLFHYCKVWYFQNLVVSSFTYCYLLGSCYQETTAHEVVMLTLQEFGITEPSWHFSLCEVSVSEGGIIKQKRLPEQLQNLAERIGLSSRYYLKTNGITETLVGDDLASELVRESNVHFLQLNAVEVAIQLTLQDFSIFRQIESTEYVDDLFDLTSRYGTPMLTQFAELVNREMFWVVTEVCSEHNLVRRSKIIKQFIKVARQCKECKNFNSMFAIISGLGHGAVSRLRLTWDKLPSKYQRLFQDLQMIMDPSRNMSKYRQLVNSGTPPIIPFYPVVKKDLTFIHLGNDTKVEGLINFEKLRMIAKEVRTLTNMCSSPYDLLTMLELGGQPPSNAMVALNQLTTGNSQQGAATVKRRKKSTAAPNPKKMFEEAQMVRRVKAYLNKMRVVTDEEKLHELSLECEGAREGGGGGSTSGPIRKRNPSPTLSTASSASSASEGTRKHAHPKFGRPPFLHAVPVLPPLPNGELLRSTASFVYRCFVLRPVVSLEYSAASPELDRHITWPHTGSNGSAAHIRTKESRTRTTVMRTVSTTWPRAKENPELSPFKNNMSHFGSWAYIVKSMFDIKYCASIVDCWILLTNVAYPYNAGFLDHAMSRFNFQFPQTQMGQGLFQGSDKAKSGFYKYERSLLADTSSESDPDQKVKTDSHSVLIYERSFHSGNSPSSPGALPVPVPTDVDVYNWIADGGKCR
ncbi:unnamed protein product, partial [Nesidiocoris tenuis]